MHSDISKGIIPSDPSVGQWRALSSMQHSPTKRFTQMTGKAVCDGDSIVMARLVQRKEPAAHLSVKYQILDFRDIVFGSYALPQRVLYRVSDRAGASI